MHTAYVLLTTVLITTSGFVSLINKFHKTFEKISHTTGFFLQRLLDAHRHIKTKTKQMNKHFIDIFNFI